MPTAFGEAASVCLEVYSEPKTATAKLCSLIAYYPTTIPDPHKRLSASFRVLVHLALGTGSEDPTIGVSRRSEALGLQGRKRTVQKRITPGIGTGGLQSKIEYPVYTYEGVDDGFAEHDLEQYDGVADALAWSRSLSMVRRGFGAEVELERTWEENTESKSRIIVPRDLVQAGSHVASQTNTTRGTPKRCCRHTPPTLPHASISRPR
jgi:hypothetical protein